MAGPVDSLKVAGVDWQTAMEQAVAALQRAEEGSKRGLNNVEMVQANSGVAQAWIALAREITIHARAQG